MVQFKTKITNNGANKLHLEDRAANSWYRFVLSFPPHLVRNYLEEFGINSSHCVLDPFCGTGTTLVECKKLGIKSVGIEAHPMTYFASTVKTNWSLDPDELLVHAREIGKKTLADLEKDGIRDHMMAPCEGADAPVQAALSSLSLEQEKLLLKNSVSPLPLHKVLVLLSNIENQKSEGFSAHERLALAQAAATSLGNLRFGPEVGIGKIKDDVEVVNTWM